MVLGVSAFDELFAEPPTLAGRVVAMEPLAERHREGLREALASPAVWRWVKVDGSRSRGAFDGWFDDALAAAADRREFAFTTVERAAGRPVGSSRYLALRPVD